MKRFLGAGWAVLLLGAIAAAAMLPQFALFIPIVAVAWILARLGWMPAFLRHRHPGARIAAGPEADVTTLALTLESEGADGPDETQMLARLIAAADAAAGNRMEGDVTTWGHGEDWDERALEPAAATLATWGLQAALASGARLALASRRCDDGRVRRVEACLAGDREILERIGCDGARALRAEGVEVVTTGWLRHAERLRAA